MPGQYLTGTEVTAESIVHLEFISANIGIIRRQSNSFRRLAFHGNDGRVRHMLVQTGQNWAQGMADERMMQLLRLFNRQLERHPRARQRLLSWHTPVIMPVFPQVHITKPVFGVPCNFAKCLVASSISQMPCWCSDIGG